MPRQTIARWRMINVKHVMDAPEPADGCRLWVEPIGLTRDFIEWFEIDAVLTDAVPALGLWEWFEENPQGYEIFRAQYHEMLARGDFRRQLEQLVRDSRFRNYTLLHQGSDAEHNTATALHEFLGEWSSYSES
jgi:uncharacterized protein YeaO (DUF488 family)